MDGGRAIIQEHGIARSRGNSARADSLVNGLVGLVRTNKPLATDALAELVLATRKGRGSMPKGIAFDLLEDLSQSAPTAGLRGSALYSLSQLDLMTRARLVWRRVAVADRVQAKVRPEIGLHMLCNYGGPDGRLVLREMHRLKEAHDPEIAYTLELMVTSEFTKAGCVPR